MTSSMPRSTSGSSLSNHSRSVSMPSSASPSSSSHHHPPPSWSTGNDSFDSDLENVPPPPLPTSAPSYQRPYTSSYKPSSSSDTPSPSTSSLLSSAHSSSSAVTPPQSSDSNYYHSSAANTRKEASTFSLYPKPRQPLTATTSLGPTGGLGGLAAAERSTSASELGLGRTRPFGRVVSVPYASLGGTALGGERRGGREEDGWGSGAAETMSSRPQYDISPSASSSAHDTSPSSASSSLPRSSSRPPLASTSSFEGPTSTTTSNFTSRTATASTTTPGPTSRFRIPLSETRPTRQPLGMPVRMSKEKQAEMREQAEREDRERLAKEAEEAERVKAAALDQPRISPSLSTSSRPHPTTSSEFNHDDSLSLTNRASSSAARSTSSHLQPSSLASSSSHPHSSSFASSLRHAAPNHPTAIVEETETDYSSSTPSSASSSSSPQTQTQTVVPSSSHQRHSPPSRSPLPSVSQLRHQPPSPSSSSSSHHLPSESSDPHRQKSRHRYSPSTPAASPPSDSPYSHYASTSSSSSIDPQEHVGAHSRALSYKPPTPPRSKPPSVANDVLPIAPSPEPYSTYFLQHEPHRPPPPPPPSQSLAQSHQQYQPQPLPPVPDPRYTSINGYPSQQQQQQEYQLPIYPGDHQQQQYQQQQTVRPMPGGPQGGHYEPLTGSTMGSSMMQQYPPQQQQQQQYLQQQQQLLPPSPTDKDTIIVKGVPYQKLCLVGRGGSSRVFKAIDKNHTVVAIKKVSLHKLDNEAIKSYENEVALLRSLRGNDKVIQMYEDETVLNERGRKLPKTLYVVMEYGEVDFSRLLEEQKGKRLNMNFVGLFWLQMLECVQVCHDRGIIHTDLKPANFVLVRGALKIIDFGISHAIEEHTVHARRDAQIGTLNYMSPESVIRSEAGQQMALGRPTDVWALGCILYQMIYGRLPFGEIKDHPSKLRAITNPDSQIKYPSTSTPTIGYAPPDAPPPPFDPELTSPVDTSAIAAMKKCFRFGEKERPTIAQLLDDPFLKPWLKKEKIPTPLETIPPGSTAISLEHLKELVLHAQSNPDASEDSKLRRLFESLQRIQVDWAEKQTAAASSPRP